MPVDLDVVIRYPIAYIKVVMVKKLKAGSHFQTDDTLPGIYCQFPKVRAHWLGCGAFNSGPNARHVYYAKKIIPEQIEMHAQICAQLPYSDFITYFAILTMWGKYSQMKFCKWGNSGLFS